MKNILIISLLSLMLLVGLHTLAAPATIIYAKGTAGINNIKVETSINPNDYSNTVWVEYSTDSSLYLVDQTPHTTIAPQRDAKTIFIDINNLQSNTMYFMKVVANNGKENAVSQSFAVLTQKDPNQKIEVEPTNTLIINTEQINNTEKTTKVQSDPFAIFILSFFPRSAFDWLAFTIIILMLIVLFRKLYVEHKIHNHKH